ncbi:MAG TPA: xanthine dehydrogenase family protein molybdopterin-binding subunit [Xanthobacteraceae bacterium]
MGVRYTGASVKRLEDPRLIGGKGRYTDDIQLPGMLQAAFVRSAHAHARIRSVDVSAAAALRGVHGVFVLADFGPAYADKRMPLTFPSPLFKQAVTQYPLARDEVCYVGEAIAIVVADNRYIAEDAAALVAVDYEALPAVIDCEAAFAGSTPAHLGAADNLVATLKGQFGEATAIFAGAPHVFKQRYDLHRGGCHSMECRGVIARHEPADDMLTVWSSTQSPYPVRKFLSIYLERDENRTRVIAPDVGGGFGPKAALYPEEIVVALAAMKLGRPVKWIEDRREHFVATTQQRNQVWELEVAARADGKILGIRGRAIHDHGAYTPYGLLLALSSLAPFPGPYAVPALDLTLHVVHTNATPTSPVRGAGRPYAAFVIERLVDLVAHELKLDPAEVRRRNYVTKEQMPYVTGMKYRDGSPISYDSGDYAGCLDKALELSGYADFSARQAQARAQGRHLGIGIASYIEDTGIGPFEGALVRVMPSGKVLVVTGAASQGQGHTTVLAQICADALGVDIANVVVESADTGKFPLGIGTIGSRIAVTAGSSVFDAAQAVRQKALKLAADALEVGEQDLVIENGEIRVAGVPDLKLSLGDAAARLNGVPGMPIPAGLSPGLEATAYHPIAKTAYANGSNVAEVEVDVATGAVTLTRYSVGHDCGTLLNPKLVDGQIIGGVVHGIGNALFERMVYDAEGQPLTMNYGEYLLPLATEMPPIAVAHMESPSPLNPLGVKGAGEGGTIPAAAAVIAAIENALAPFNVRVSSHPISPQEIVELIDRASLAGAADSAKDASGAAAAPRLASMHPEPPPG